MYAPSKTFNLAGLVGSYHVIYNDALEDRVESKGMNRIIARWMWCQCVDNRGVSRRRNMSGWKSCVKWSRRMRTMRLYSPWVDGVEVSKTWRHVHCSLSLFKVHEEAQSNAGQRKPRAGMSAWQQDGYVLQWRMYSYQPRVAVCASSFDRMKKYSWTLCHQWTGGFPWEKSNSNRPGSKSNRAYSR